MVAITELISLFTGTLSTGILGNGVIVGIFVAILFLIFALKGGLPIFDTFIILIAPALILLSLDSSRGGLGLLPLYIAPLIIGAISVVIAMAFLKAGRGQLG